MSLLQQTGSFGVLRDGKYRVQRIGGQAMSAKKGKQVKLWAVVDARGRVLLEEGNCVVQLTKSMAEEMRELLEGENPDFTVIPLTGRLPGKERT